MLEAILPDSASTLLLRAVLCSGEEAPTAWRDWRQRVGNPTDALQADPDETIRSLLPLLHHAVARNTLSVEPELATVLRTACFREELRYESGCEVAAGLLRSLQDADVDVLASGGWMLAQRVYPWPAARHSGALRLTVRPENLERSAERALSLGFAERSAARWTSDRRRQLIHASGLALVIGESLLETPFASPDLGRVWRESEVATLAGVRVRVPSPADTLLQVCARASIEGSRRSLLWAVDAWLLLAGLDPQAVLAFRERVRASHLILPASLLLYYVAIDLRAEAPVDLLDGLLREAADPAPLGLEQGIACGRLSGLDVAALLRAAEGLGLRSRIVLHAAVPSADFLRRSRGAMGLPELAKVYAGRPLRAAARGLASLRQRSR